METEFNKEGNIERALLSWLNSLKIQEKLLASIKELKDGVLLFTFLHSMYYYIRYK